MAPALVELKEIRGRRQHDRHRSTGEVGASASLAQRAALTDQRNRGRINPLRHLLRAREAGRRDADRPAIPAGAAWAVQRQ